MKKIKNTDRQLVESAKIKITNLAKRQDEIFNELLKDLNIEDEENSTWIFDFIFNAGDISDAYYEMIESTIFEEN